VSHNGRMASVLWVTLNRLLRVERVKATEGKAVCAREADAEAEKDGHPGSEEGGQAEHPHERQQRPH
jgi:hypothetical protein